MSDTTRHLIESHEHDWETRAAASYRHRPRPFKKSAQRFRKSRRRADLGTHGRGAQRSTYRADRASRLAM